MTLPRDLVLSLYRQRNRTGYVLGLAQDKDKAQTRAYDLITAHLSISALRWRARHFQMFLQHPANGREESPGYFNNSREV